MNKKKEIDKLARLTVLANFVNSKLKEQKTLVKSFVTEEDKVLKGVEHKLNVIIRSYKRFDSEAFRKDQPEVYNDYKTKVVSSMELKPLIDAEQESELLTENFPLMQIQLQSSNQASHLHWNIGTGATAPRVANPRPFSISSQLNKVLYVWQEKKGCVRQELREVKKKLSTINLIITCNKLGYVHTRTMPSDNNDIINRPFADLQERMAEVDRLKRSDDITNRREVDYRAICNYLNSEIFHLISSVDDPKVKAWARKIVSDLHNMVGKDIL